MSENSVIGVFETMAAAESAIRKLDKSSYPIEKISIVGQNLQSEKEIHGYITTGDVAKSSAGTGAWMGGFFGLLMGAAFVWVPGFGPLVIAGPLSAALLGGIEGAVVGAAGAGLLGSLLGLGVSKQHIIKYEERLKGGDYLVVAQGTNEEIVKAKTILADDATEVTTHA